MANTKLFKLCFDWSWLCLHRPQKQLFSEYSFERTAKSKQKCRN